MLGEIKSEEAVLPLTRMLRDSKDDRARLVAALSLIKIGSERSTYVVKQGIKLNDSEKVRKMCDHLYNAHLKGKLDNTKTYENDMLAQILTD
jgi:HEAT repeat protein